MSQHEASNVVSIPVSTMTKALLEGLVSECGNYQSEMDSARGSMGGAIKTMEESHNLHRKAFKWAMQLRRMEPEKRTALLQDLKLYIKWLDLDNQPDLFEGDQAEAAE